MALLKPSTDVRRAADRFATDFGWLDSKHSFSFGQHYDPDNTHFGLLLVNNDDVVDPGTGFETHPHRDMEIVTWVLRGQLVHQDSQGHNGLIYPGLAQRMSAGTGILHSEKNDSWRLTGEPSHADPVHFVQMWVVPERERVLGVQPPEIGREPVSGATYVRRRCQQGHQHTSPGVSHRRSVVAHATAVRRAAFRSGRVGGQPGQSFRPAHASRSSTGRVLTIRSAGTPAASARSQP